MNNEVRWMNKIEITCGVSFARKRKILECSGGSLRGVSKENVSPDQPRSSSLASAFDATAEIFTSFDLAFR